MTGTLSRRPSRRFWGWGAMNDGLSETELASVDRLLQGLGDVGPALAEPQLGDYDLHPSRGSVPTALAHVVSNSPYDRLTHCYGKSFADVARMWMRHVPNAPDWVAFPQDEGQIAELFEWAGRHNIAVIPFGGGTSVVGGVEAAVGDGYAATLSLDLEHFD